MIWRLPVHYPAFEPHRSTVNVALFLQSEGRCTLEDSCIYRCMLEHGSRAESLNEAYTSRCDRSNDGRPASAAIDEYR
jgi:hypothetical protein